MMQNMILVMALLVLGTDDNLATPARPLNDPGQWVGPQDYPPSALRTENQGASSFTLIIDASGSVTDCTITQSSGTPLLDETACRLAKERARFSPARDAQGVPTAGRYSNRVRWQIPAGDWRSAPVFLPRGPRPESGFPNVARLADDAPNRAALLAAPPVPYVLDIDAVGAVTRCEVTGKEMDAAIADAACTHLKALKFVPARDIDDAPAIGRLKGELRWMGTPMPGAVPPSPPAPRARMPEFVAGSLAVDFVVGKDGTVRDCKERTEGANPFQSERSTFCSRSRPLEPYRDASGAAVESKVQLKISVDVQPVAGADAKEN